MLQHKIKIEMNESFGIKKIIDCKINEDGKQMFKVKWEPTWEPAENLSSCQHLIDEFWSFIYKSKSNEVVAVQYGRNLSVRNNISNTNNDTMDNRQYSLTEDNKAEVNKLIARTSATSVGNKPNNHMNGVTHSHAHNFIDSSVIASIPGIHNSLSIKYQPNKTSVTGSNSDFMKTESSYKSSPSNSQIKTKTSTGNAAALKYIENFTNQYVKIILVCKICNKEQSLKFSHNWKKHYLSHVSDEEKPHKCPHCPKAFVTAPQVKKHIKAHHENVMKQEFFPM